MPKTYAAITAVEGYVPPDKLTNKELEQMVDTNDDWIMSRTGIAERRILKGKNKGTSVMAIEALNGLLKKRGLDPAEIDLIICATVTPDMQFPATARPESGCNRAATRREPRNRPCSIPFPGVFLF